MNKNMKNIVLLGLLTLLCALNICTAEAKKQDFTTEFQRTVVYDLEGLIQAAGGLHGNGLGDLTAEEEQEFSRANCTVDVVNMELKAFCYQLRPEDYTQLQFVGARVLEPSYRAGGLRLGDSFGEKKAAAFANNMRAMGWSSTKGSVPGDYGWEKVLATRAIEFHVRTREDRIVDIFWLQYLKTTAHDCY